MIISCPKETKPQEGRVGVTPAGAAEFVSRGHRVIIEKDAGKASGFTDEEYIDAGAEICADAKKVFADADMVIKVKELQP